MAIFRSLQIRLHNYFLRKKIEGNKVKRNPVSFDQVKTIGLLFDGQNLEDEKTVSKYAERLKKLGKKVDILVYFDDKEERENYHLPYFNNKDLNWTLSPSGENVTQIINQNFDILMGLHLHKVEPLEYIATLSKAHLRVGKFRDNNESCYDLMIDTPEGDSLQNFIGRIDFFLKTINKND